METFSLETVEVELENKDLWDKFNTLGTEMVITKAGRRMFPFLEVSLKGLHPDETYMVILDITKVDDRRYKYNERENHWTYMDSRLLSPTPVGMFVHHMCPCYGSELCAQPMSFNRVKLTNNPTKVAFGHILLESMGRYVPRISIISYHDYINHSWENGVAFMFEETEFIAVTAYMNKEITKLKIDNNPFARAFREFGLKGKVFQRDTTSSDPNTNDQHKETVEKSRKISSETVVPTTITYFNNKGESNNDDIKVVHVNPSSIFVTDVPPSSPSTNSLMESSFPPRSSPKMSTTSEVNIVFKPVFNSTTCTPTKEKVSQLDSLLYPRTPSQSITLEMSQFITGEKSGGKSNSDIGVDVKRDILCKVTDVRSIKVAPFPSGEQENNTKMRSSSKCDENMECLSNEDEEGDKRDECEGIEAEMTEKSCKYEEHYKGMSRGSKFGEREIKSTDEHEKNVEKRKHIDEMHDNGDCCDGESLSDNPSELTKKAIHLKDASTTRDEMSTRGNKEEQFEKKKMRDLVDARPEKIQQQSEKEMSDTTNEENTSQGNVDRDNVTESTPNKDCPRENTSKPQISKLLNFVNSVSMPVLKFGIEKKTASSDKDRNNNSSLLNSPEILARLAQKRSVDDRPNEVLKKARLIEESNYGLKSLDQSDKSISHSSDILKSMDQSEGSLKSVQVTKEVAKPVNVTNGFPSSEHHQDKKFESSTTTQDNTKQEFCNEKSIFESNIVQEQRRNPETTKEKNINKIAKGIPTTVIGVGNDTKRIRRLVLNGLRSQNSRTKYLEQCEGKERGFVQNQVNSSRTEDPSCVDEGNRPRQGIENNNSAPTKSFPVILSSYSIDPSKFSNQQIIDLNSETRVDKLSYDNRVPVVYPAENFYLEKYQGKEGVEKCPSETEQRCEPMVGEGTRQGCVYPGKSNNPHFRKIVPKTISPGSHSILRKQEDFIDLNSSESAYMYQRQADDSSYLATKNKGVPLQVLYTFETKMSLGRAPDPRLPEIYLPTRTTSTGYACNVVCSTLPIATVNQGNPTPATPGKYY